MSDKEKSKVITIGGTGLVGSVLIKSLNNYFPMEDHSIDGPSPEFRLDLTKPTDFLRLLKQEKHHTLAVINLAAATDTSRAFTDPDYRDFSYRLNFLAPANASLVCQHLGIPYLHVGTDFVYDGHKPNLESYNESDIPNPIEPYGKTKFQGEAAVLKNGGMVLTLAFPFIERPLRPDLVEKFSRKFQTGDFINAFSDQIITPTYIPDFIEITRLLLTNIAEDSPIYRGRKFHCVGSSFETPFSVAQEIAKHFGFNPDLIRASSVREYNIQAAEKNLRPYQENLALSNLKIRQTIGYTPRTFNQALEQYPIED